MTSIEYAKSGRPIQKDKTSYQRRQSLRNGIPGIRSLDKMQIEYIEFAATGIRKFVLDTKTPGAYLCYLPGPGKLPLTGDRMSLFKEFEMKMNGNYIHTGMPIVVVASVSMVSPDYRVARLTFKK